MTNQNENQLRSFFSNIKNTKIGMGAGGLSGEGKGYGFGPISTKDAIDLVRYAIDLGCCIFDTAPCYGYYTASTRLGEGIFQSGKR